MPVTSARASKCSRPPIQHTHIPLRLAPPEGEFSLVKKHCAVEPGGSENRPASVGLCYLTQHAAHVRSLGNERVVYEELLTQPHVDEFIKVLI